MIVETIIFFVVGLVGCSVVPFLAYYIQRKVFNHE